jgi:hypothetical protein
MRRCEIRAPENFPQHLKPRRASRSTVPDSLLAADLITMVLETMHLLLKVMIIHNHHIRCDSRRFDLDRDRSIIPWTGRIRLCMSIAGPTHV